MELVAVFAFIGVIAFLEYVMYSLNWSKELTYKCYFTESVVTEGDEFEFVEEVTNKKLLPLPWMKSEITTEKWLDFAEIQSIVTDRTRFVSSFFVLKSYHKVVRRWKIRALKRGVYGIDSVVLVASNLLGSLNMSIPVKKENHCGTVRVFPKKPDNIDIQFESLRLLGETMINRCIIPDPFLRSGVREYTGMEPITRINWKASAKHQKLMIHKNEFSTDQSVAVILNMQSKDFEMSNTSNPAVLENCIRICAWIFYETMKRNMSVQFLSNTSLKDSRTPIITEPYFGKEHTLRLLEILTEIKMMNTENFPEFILNSKSSVFQTDVLIVTAYVNKEIIEFAENSPNVKILLVGSGRGSLSRNIMLLADYFK